MPTSVLAGLVLLLTLALGVGFVTADEEAPKTASELGFENGHPPARVVDMNSWDMGEDCRWAFQHISEIIPVANITRGSGMPKTLERAPHDLGSFQFNVPEGKRMSIERLLMDTYTDGFLVLRAGKIVYEKYFNGMQPHTRHLLMSVSKSVTGTLAGILVNDGRLDPRKRVTHYIPELANSPGYADTTVRHVLDMTTAIVFSEDYADPKAEVKVHEKASAWRGRSDVAEAGVQAFAQTIKKDAAHEHGVKFHYASINTDVLGWLIERASGERFHNFMEKNLWSKLGAEHDAQISVDYKGSPVANGGFCMTLRDLGRFGQMVLDDGHYNGRRVVSSGWFSDIRHRGNNSAWTKYDKIWPEGWYRNQWYVTNDEHGSFFAVGVNGQNVWINPTTRVVIVKFSSTPVSSDPTMQLPTWAGMDALARHVGQLPE